jgi:hypothetical protein
VVGYQNQVSFVACTIYDLPSIPHQGTLLRRIQRAECGDHPYSWQCDNLESFEDDWIAADKLQHFVSCGLISAISYISASLFRRSHQYRLSLGACLGCIVGLTKELGDYLQVLFFYDLCMTDPLREGAPISFPTFVTAETYRNSFG